MPNSVDSQMQDILGVARRSLQDRRSAGGPFRLDELHRSGELSDGKLRGLLRLRGKGRTISRVGSRSHRGGRIYYWGRSVEKRAQ